MIAVDANLIGYFFLHGVETAHCEQIYRLDRHWVAPRLWRSEVRNILSGYIRRRGLHLVAAQRIMDEADALMSGRDYEVVSERVLAFVQMSTLTAYDCEYVALASGLAIPLVTVDRQIVSQFPDIAITPERYLRR